MTQKTDGVRSLLNGAKNVRLYVLKLFHSFFFRAKNESFSKAMSFFVLADRQSL